MTTPLEAGYSVLGWNHPGFSGSTVTRVSRTLTCSHTAVHSPVFTLLVERGFASYIGLRSHSLRSYKLDLLFVSTTLGSCHFSVSVPRLWNELPHDICQCNTLPAF